MYNFDGEYRRTKEQNLAGASKLASGKDELINRAHKERMKRQEERKKHLSATCLQKFVRGFLSRSRFQQILRTEFDERFKICRYRPSVPVDVDYLIVRAYFMHKGRRLCFYRLDIVARKVLAINRHLLHLASINTKWLWRLKVLTAIILKAINIIDVERSFDLGFFTICKTLDVFTAIDVLDVMNYSCVLKQILKHLYDNNYMLIITEFFLKLEASNSLHNPTYCQKKVDAYKSMVNFSLKLIGRPFINLDVRDDNDYRDALLDSLFKMLTRKPWLTPLVKSHIMPMFKNKTDFTIEHSISLFLEYGCEKYVPAALYFFLCMDKDQTAVPGEYQAKYFLILSRLTQGLTLLMTPFALNMPFSDSILPPSEVQEIMPTVPAVAVTNNSLKELIQDCVALLDTSARSKVWLRVLQETISSGNDYATIIHHSTCIMNLLLYDPNFFYNSKIICDLWRDDLWCVWLRALWTTINNQVRHSREGPSLVIELLKRGILLRDDEASKMLPLLMVFSSFFFMYVSFLTDEQLLRSGVIREDDSNMFSALEIMQIGCQITKVVVGLIIIGYPDTADPKRWCHMFTPTTNINYNKIVWYQTMKECVKLVRELYYRNESCNVVPKSLWTSSLFNMPSSISVLLLMFESLKEPRFLPFSAVTPTTPDDSRPVSSSSSSFIRSWCNRSCTFAATVPFATSFEERKRVLISVLNPFRQQPPLQLLLGPYIVLEIRRNFLYEDSFNRLTVVKAPDLRMPIKVHFKNSYDVNETGVDGGGLFKEFMVELLKTAFDPDRGFFKATSDNKLYPNPHVDALYPHFIAHYFFIGRLLAKAIYEHILIDVSFADFFLARIIDNGYYPSQALSLDPEVYRNVGQLKAYRGNFADLGLYFTLVDNCYGTHKVIDLKPNGLNTPVTENTVLEYTHLLVRQKVQATISKQAKAFTKGLNQVLPLNMIRLFTPTELQLVISGDINSPINIQDMKNNTKYADAVTIDHPTIQMFWNIVNTFTGQEISLLLKFVTSCVRPPLNGFKDMAPPFCIQLVLAPDDSPLPTASTCLNMLKLPIYSCEQVMREKLLYAINSRSGFELS